MTSEREFARVLAELRALSINELDKGKRFERLVAAAMRVAPQWATQFSEVLLWDEWEGSEGEPDTGIDLVALHRRGEGVTAIQCKFYDETSSLRLEDVGSFFGLLGQQRFSEGMIVTTAPPSSNLRKTIEGHEKPVVVLGTAALAGSGVEWAEWRADSPDTLHRSGRRPLPHQREAIKQVLGGFQDHQRGKLVMACGTGKTFTGQQIAEQLVGAGGRVLVLLPSISLLSQTLKEWAAHATIPLTPFAVCSDSKAGKRSTSEDISPFDLVVSPTTEPQALVTNAARTPPQHMMVVFSTYHSTPVVGDAQAAGLGSFDLVIADEAHRTTGVTIADGDDSNFTRVHDDVYISASRRLYMTATPRIFSDGSKAKAEAEDAWLASMDDEEVFGPEFHRLGFREAVDRGLLTDYRVLVLAVDEGSVATAFQQLISDEDNDLNLGGATKLTGVLNALSKRDPQGRVFRADDTVPMQTALAFSNTIADSKRFAALMSEVADQYGSVVDGGEDLVVELDHVDGGHNALEREAKLSWLSDDVGEDRIRVLSNARCLTEGVDVPSLDAVIFLEPRNSMVDVIQAVGRVMRLADGKQRGYVILPIGIPAGISPAEALADHGRYRVVWQVLNALRSHDERLNAVVNQLDLNDQAPDMVDVQGSSMGSSDVSLENGDEEFADEARQLVMGFPLEEVRESIYAQMVAKVGTRHYWEDWADDIAAIAGRHETRIRALVTEPGSQMASEFEHFVDGLRSILNEGIDTEDAVSMLSQHLITRPVFDALFSDYDFIDSNPVSTTMQSMIERLDAQAVGQEAETLERFYADVARRAEGIDNAAGKQKIVTELYERFFAKALPKTAEALGIVYTPIPIVDFVLRSADAALRLHFDTSISEEGVHVLDPFTGTGTFIVRLLQMGLIDGADLGRKYLEELHANEVLLLAYYIAAINIEATYHEVRGASVADGYEPFPGVVYTDTFHLAEADEGAALDVFGRNSSRARRQQQLPIRVIVGNPPYSAGQTSANDNAANLSYPVIDERIASTYAARSTATLKNSLYDSYIRALRWASDRVINNPAGGVIAFVSNGGYIDTNTADGLRKSLVDEFQHLYVYNLRGNQRTAGEQSRREGGKVFGAGSRATVAILVAVRDPTSAGGEAVLHYRDIGDYLSRTEKLSILEDQAAGGDPLSAVEWRAIEPNEHGDWINQRSERFTELDPIQDESDPNALFSLRSRGLLTSRDAWNYNGSRTELERNANRMVEFFNAEVDRFRAAHPDLTGTLKAKAQVAKGFVNLDEASFSWDRADFQRVARGEHLGFDPEMVFVGQYRPFQRQYVNAARSLNNTVYQLPQIYPDPQSRTPAITFTEPGSRVPFSVLMVDHLPDDKLYIDASRVLPLRSFVNPSVDGAETSLFDSPADTGWHSNLTTKALTTYSELDASIGDDDLFHYVYAVLHSRDYRTAFAADLKRSMPRIPRPPSAADFWAFADAGRALANLHLNYEEIEPWPALDITFAEGFDAADPASWHVEKMRYPKLTDPETGKKVDDPTVVVVNSRITVAGIPPRAHDYRLGSRSAIDWVLNQYQVKRHRASGIVNDPNDWSRDVGRPSYIFDLLGSVVTVSLKTLDVVDGLPRLHLS